MKHINFYFCSFYSSRRICSNKTKWYSPKYDVSQYWSTCRHVTTLTYFHIL